MPDTEFAPDLNVVERQPTTVEDARDQIFETRGRISATLDEIESRIVDTKQELRRKADVLRPVRERIRIEPWKALAIAAGVGLALGLLTGGREDRSRQARRVTAARRRGSRGAIAPAGWTGRAIRPRTEDWRDEVEDEVHDHDAGEPARHGPELRERVAHHLLRSLTGAISDGISSRVRHAATS